MFNPIIDIDRRIEDLQRLKSGYQNVSQPNALKSDFKAQYLNNNEKVEDLLVQTKTCFIDLLNKEIAIKEVNGDVVRYGLILPLDEKDLKIQELEKRLMEYEQHTSTNNEINKSNEYVNGDDESTTKRTSKSVSK